ncbi:SpoIIAA family protein [Marinimicrococcus flavescens]|uniref:STAS/SEC14 domain-containing protein n=1 Tax=Marinimicrococcus flavescens TaxID=3031815 RepID=A0AAP3XS01_9PROT|nr:STAS/SEC14 domain-containing protein [Marinimicrococcus flavescens]
MFERLPAPDHVLAFRLGGTMTGQDIASYRSLLDAMLETHERIGLCIDVTGLADMNADAFVEGARADMALLAHLRQLGRCAFVSDKEWPRALAGFMAALFPTFETRVFTPHERDQALSWAAERPKAPQAAPALRLIPTSRDDVLAFEIDGVIAANELSGIVEHVDAFLARHEKVRMLARIKRLGGIDPASFLQGGLLPMKLAAMQKLERYAIVGAPAWMRPIIETVNPAFPAIDMRAFAAENEADAWSWLGAEPAR